MMQVDTDFVVGTSTLTRMSSLSDPTMGLLAGLSCYLEKSRRDEILDAFPLQNPSVFGPETLHATCVSQ